jgi:hypothetical protein
MNKIHIVTAGDSFTEGTLKRQIDSEPLSYDSSKFVTNYQNGMFYYQSLATPNSNLKYNSFLLKELLDSNLYFCLHNIGTTSSGNHVIAHFYKEKVKQLLAEGILAENIIGTIQLSALVRPKNLYFSKDIPGIENDYLENFNEKNNITYDILIANIENIENIIKFNLDNGITKFKIFHGWSIFYKDELIKFDLYNKLKAINMDYYWYESYPTQEDLLMTSCVGEKKINWKSLIPKALITKKERINAALVYGDEIGGMTEYCRKNLQPEDYYYCSINDAHLNSFGNNFFYNQIYRKWLYEWGIVSKENISLKNKNFKTLLESMDAKSKQEFYDTAYYDFSNINIIESKKEEYILKYFSDFESQEKKKIESEQLKLNLEIEKKMKADKKEQDRRDREVEQHRKNDIKMQKEIQRNLNKQLKLQELEKKKEEKRKLQEEKLNKEIEKQIVVEIPKPKLTLTQMQKLEIEIEDREAYLLLKRTQLNKMIQEFEQELQDREEFFTKERKRLDDYNYELGALIGKKKFLIEQSQKELDEVQEQRNIKRGLI